MLNLMFNHFEIPLGNGVLGTMKQIFVESTILECECVEGKAKERYQKADVLG